MASLRLSVLGPPRLERDARPIELPLRRAVALLVYLAVTNRPQARETLAGLLWPDSDEREARGRLRRTLHRLAEALGDDVILAEGDTLRLSPEADLWLDSQAFEAHAAAALREGELDQEQLAEASRAAELYGDDFLAGFALPDSAAWDEWQFLQRESLRQTAARVLEWLVDACSAREEWEAAIEHARRWLALDPLHEPAQRALMRAYAFAGQQAAALRQYRECVRLLEAELGVEPEAETTALHEAIRTRRVAPPTPLAVETEPVSGPEPVAETESDPLQESKPVPPPPSAPLPAERPTAAPPVTPAAPYREERRWVTVLSADLSDFASLAEQLDPEDVRTLAHRCTERLSEEIRRYGGTVINAMGDALLAVFGAPVAHEDDAERAVRAGLAIRSARLSWPDFPSIKEGQLDVRVGINTGEVMAGLSGPDERRDYSVMGGTVNLATRLMSAAPARGVLVGEETYRSTRQRVQYRDVPPIETRGRERSLPAWEALDATPASRARPLGTAPLVGRDQELTLLVGTWTKVSREARPHLVTVLGEPGIGKSRLIAEFERRARALGNVVLLRGRCLPYGEALGYGALAMALREAAGITGEDDVETARRRLVELVVGTLAAPGGEGDPHEIARHLALLSGLDSPADRAASAVDERTLHVSVRRFLEALARRHPVCLLLDDIQWADEALLRLIEFVAARAQAAPLLLVTQARPELLERRPTWGGGMRAFTSLPLEPLDGDASEALARALCREKGLPEEAARRVGSGAGGNPLFAEELIATIAERREAAGVPSVIKALISARLDRLPPDERQAIQRASVFGKHFWLRGLTALGAGATSEDTVAEQLESLEQRDLLRRQPRSRFHGDREYAFKHDLIRDVAYEMLPRAERRRLHGQAADWIEPAAGERADELLDLLAHHAVQAEQHERALGYLTRAAQRARRAAAHREEAALLGRAIAIAARSGRSDLVADLRAERGRAFASVGLWADARRELEAAIDGLPLDRQERRAEVLVDLSRACNWSMDAPALHRRAGEALELARAVRRADLAMDARFWLAWADGSDGEVGSAIERYRQAFDRAEQLGIPLASSVLPLYATTLCWAGQFALAIECSRRAVRVAREAGDTDSTLLALQVLGLALAGTGSYGEAMQVFDEATRFGREYGIGPFLARSIALSAGFHLDVFDFDGHAALAEEAREVARSVGFSPPLVSASIDLLLNLARQGQVSQAEQLAGEVAGTIERAGSWHGWLWKLRFTQARAEIALARGDALEAVQLAGAAHEQSRGRRPKYQALGLVTRAQALSALGRTKDAGADLHEAVGLARTIGDPALFLRSATVLLDHDGDDPLLAEARSAARRVLASLPTSEMRARFQRAEAVRRLGALVSADTPADAHAGP